MNLQAYNIWVCGSAENPEGLFEIQVHLLPCKAATLVDFNETLHIFIYSLDISFLWPFKLLGIVWWEGQDSRLEKYEANSFFFTLC